ncbi:hypothetical protein NBRC116589_12130 [Ruegeria sp. HU-ET01832]
MSTVEPGQEPPWEPDWGLLLGQAVASLLYRWVAEHGRALRPEFGLVLQSGRAVAQQFDRWAEAGPDQELRLVFGLVSRWAQVAAPLLGR